eukprot:330687_1
MECTTYNHIIICTFFHNSFRFTTISSNNFPSLIVSFPFLSVRYHCFTSLFFPMTRTQQKVVVSPFGYRTCINFSYWNPLHIIYFISLHCIAMPTLYDPKMNFADGRCPPR